MKFTIEQAQLEQVVIRTKTDRGNEIEVWLTDDHVPFSVKMERQEYDADDDILHDLYTVIGGKYVSLYFVMLKAVDYNNEYERLERKSANEH